MNTRDIYNIFLYKYNNNDFRIIGNNVQQSKTLEIQNAHFEVDKPWIIREPNYEYFNREKDWYISHSLNVNDIPGGAPKMWLACANKDGYVNSNYGWCIYSDDNYRQYECCKNKLIEDIHTREAIMIYNRPSMQYEYNTNGMHDFMCCQNVHYFINERNGQSYLDCIVNFRSNDAVFGFNNDSLWAQYVLNELTKDLYNELLKKYNIELQTGKIYWNAGSLHIYERHFNILDSFETKQNILRYYND